MGDASYKTGRIFEEHDLQDGIYKYLIYLVWEFWVKNRITLLRDNCYLQRSGKYKCKANTGIYMFCPWIYLFCPRIYMFYLDFWFQQHAVLSRLILSMKILKGVHSTQSLRKYKIFMPDINR